MMRVWTGKAIGRKRAEEGVCPNKVTLAPRLMCMKPSERNITLLSPLLVYFSMLPHRATPHGPPHTARTDKQRDKEKDGVKERKDTPH